MTGSRRGTGGERRTDMNKHERSRNRVCPFSIAAASRTEYQLLRQRGPALAFKRCLADRRNEDWRFTNVAPLVETAFELRRPPTTLRKAARRCRTSPGHATRTCSPAPADRHLPPRVPSTADLPSSPVDGAIVAASPTALAGTQSSVEPHLGRTSLSRRTTPSPPSTPLPRTTARFRLYPDRTRSSSSRSDRLFSPRRRRSRPSRIRATLSSLGNGSSGDGRRALSSGRSDVYFTNAVTEIVVGDNADLDHYKVQQEGPQAITSPTCRSCSAASSRLLVALVALGGAWSRNEIRAASPAKAPRHLNGLYLGDGTPAHRQPHGHRPCRAALRQP